MKNEEMIKEAYEFFEKTMIEKLGEDWGENFEEHEMKISAETIEEMKAKFPEVSEDDLSNYQESINWT